MQRRMVLGLIAERILNIRQGHPVRVGIDGVTASGKTTLADELANLLRDSGRSVIRASIDDFHNPPAVRYRLGRVSPEGYYRDTFDYTSIRALLPGASGTDGSRRYRTGSYGQPDGSSVSYADQQASVDAITIVDGVFLFRPELNDCWDYRVFVQVAQARAMERGIARDAGWMGGNDAARERYATHYVPGERLYLEDVHLWALADVVVTNDVFEAPEARFRED